jgi:hypothetical protein
VSTGRKECENSSGQKELHKSDGNKSVRNVMIIISDNVVHILSHIIGEFLARQCFPAKLLELGGNFLLQFLSFN